MKKVLFVEDDIYVFEMYKNELESSFEIYRVRAVDEAIAADVKYGPFDCYVIDLQILAFGLTLSEMAEYQNIEGYAFVKNYLWKDKNEQQIKEIKSKLVICSRYILDLKKLYKDEIDGLNLVDKTKGFEKEVASLINKICK